MFRLVFLVLFFIPLKLSAASRGESSILKENYNSVFARLPHSKLRGMRSLPNSKVAFFMSLLCQIYVNIAI
jgi:hypothetical protein